jgi:hypothetical protein
LGWRFARLFSDHWIKASHPTARPFSVAIAEKYTPERAGSPQSRTKVAPVRFLVPVERGVHHAVIVERALGEPAHLRLPLGKRADPFARLPHVLETSVAERIRPIQLEVE